MKTEKETRREWLKATLMEFSAYIIQFRDGDKKLLLSLVKVKRKRQKKFKFDKIYVQILNYS